MQKYFGYKIMLSKNIENDGNKYSRKNWSDIQSITEFLKNSQEEERIMTDKEQNKQNKVLLILVKVKKCQHFMISLPDTAFKENYTFYEWSFFHILCNQYDSLPISAFSITCLLFVWQLRTIQGAEISSVAASDQELEDYNTSHPKSNIALSQLFSML